jgi:hypothetical protein
MKKQFVDRLSNTWIDKIISRAHASLEVSTMSFFHDDDGLSLIRKIRKEDFFLLSRPSEMYVIHSLAAAQRRLDGDYAEVGVYKGATAKLICEAKGDKTLHLFDTFEGLPQHDEVDRRFSENMFSTSFDKVRGRLSGYHGVRFYKGLFPQTAAPVGDARFAFVHLDVDLYQSTKDALEFFYPRLVPGGILLTHDYPSADGVCKAFSDFLSDKPELIIGLPLSQGMIVKRCS